jgi:hypothetical protein
VIYNILPLTHGCLLLLFHAAPHCAGPSSSSHGQATADTLRASSSTPQQTAPSSNTPPAARTNPNQQQQQHANVLQYLGLSCSHSYWLPLPLSSLSLTPTFGSTVPGLPSVSTAVEDAEDEMSQVYSEWGQVCPASTVPLLSTHASTPSCSRGSGAAVVWAPLGSLQQDGEVPRTVYPGAHSGIPVQLDLTATEVSSRSHTMTLPAALSAVPCSCLAKYNLSFGENVHVTYSPPKNNSVLMQGCLQCAAARFCSVAGM